MDGLLTQNVCFKMLFWCYFGASKSISAPCSLNLCCCLGVCFGDVGGPVIDSVGDVDELLILQQFIVFFKTDM